MSDHWSTEDQNAARVIFDRASNKAKSEFIERHKMKKIHTIEELWAYELELREWRREYQTIFQYTYSTLDTCFGIALRRGWLTKDNLSGLRDERIERIKMISSLK